MLYAVISACACGLGARMSSSRRRGIRPEGDGWGYHRSIRRSCRKDEVEGEESGRSEHCHAAALA
jgi:hypothetical protein